MKIQGKNYDFKEENIPIEKLRFWLENPRIHAEIYGPYNNPEIEELSDGELQEKIYAKLRGKDNVRVLLGKLDKNGGLIDRLIIRKKQDEDAYYVLEGNRRLAACKMAIERANKDPKPSDSKKIIDNFSNIPCSITPENMSDSAIFSLIGILHIDGKTPWSPFAKASYIKRREEILRQENNTADTDTIRSTIVKELGDTPEQIKIQISNIDMMKENSEKDTEKYSYYNVLNTFTASKDSLDDEVKRARWLKEIKETQKTAQEFRKTVNNVCRSPKQLKAFLDGKKNLEAAAEASEAEGSTNSLYKKANKFREYIDRHERRFLSVDPTDNVHNKLAYEFKKLKQLVEKINNKLQEKNGG